LVTPTARVRRERFGLLFYDTRSARLTYVASGDSLVPVKGPSAGAIALAVGDDGARPGQAVARLLGQLMAKGLIVAVESAEH
jgi:putative mycofactocin binding protein MftB